jgi:heme oxygenase (biliverdin-IX-beta and delta-forming)
MHAADDFNPSRSAKRLLREAGRGALATLSPGGAPYASLVTVATAMDGVPILLLSRLARHTANVGADPRVSLLLEGERERDPLEGARVSLSGILSRTDDPAVRRRFLAHHPSAEAYAGFADFGFWRMQMSGGHLVAGFGRIADLRTDELLTDIGDAGQLAASEEDAVAHMNEDHRAALALYAANLLGEEAGNWRIVSLDPEGCDLILGERARRLEFPERVTEAGALRRMLARLAQEAKARA